jgi:hypothetical protein
MLWVGFLLAWLRVFDDCVYIPHLRWIWLAVLFSWIGAGIGSLWNRLGTGALVGAAIGTILSGVSFHGF